VTVALAAALFLVVAVLLGLGNVMGYHRLLTHRAFKSHYSVRATLTLLSAMHSGSPMLWAGVHRVHHALSDQPGDPHNSTLGFWYAHAGWLYGTKNVPLSMILALSGFGLQVKYLVHDVRRLLGKQPAHWRRMCRDLQKEKLMLFLDTPLVIPALFGAQVAAAWLVAGWWGIAWLWAMHVVQNNSSWMINSFCHWPGFGYAAKDSRDHSRDVPWLSWLTSGDAYHNSHHRFPHSAKAALDGGWDLSWWVTLALARVGLVWDIKLPKGYALPDWLPQRQPAPQSS
jgi:stearoyl-CoA desaturase (delta-9 desaturase)